MRTLRLSLAGTIILALLGGLGAVVLAQGEAEPATWVSGPETQAPCEVGDVESLIQDGPLTGDRGLSISCTDDLGDPRLSGTSIKLCNDDCYERAGCVYWGTQEMTGPKGFSEVKGVDYFSSAPGMEGKVASGSSEPRPTRSITTWERRAARQTWNGGTRPSWARTGASSSRAMGR